MEYRILGPLVVEGDEGSIPLGGPKEQALLGLLVVEANRVTSIDRISEELWGDDQPPTAVKTIRSYVSRIRKRLGDQARLTTEPGGYVLHLAPTAIDAARFEAALETGLAHRRREDHLSASEELRWGLSQWRGTVLAGLDDHGYVRLEATRLEERRLQALEARIDSDLELGRHQEVVSEVELLVEQHPYREALTRLLMLALHRSGRRTEALRAYATARSRLGEHIGIEPSGDLQELERAILLDDVAAEPGPADGSEHNLPSPRNTFVGRADELVEIGGLLAKYRCVTLTGVGGSGKTRLGIESARRELTSRLDGVWLVELAPVSDPEGLAEHVLATFGERGSHAQEPAAVLTDRLASKRSLLVLDNCEHLTPAVAAMVDRLLDGCPDLRVLATSREPLRVAGEAIFQVPPLAVPTARTADDPSDVDSVRLFVDRVHASQRGFELSGELASAVATICRRLDGIPLAIELAAARARTVPVIEIAARLDDRFVLLAETSWAAPARQRTLEAAIDWSYELLSESERILLQRLSVFSGSWTAEAALEITTIGDTEAEVIVLIGQLVDKSLVETDSDGRYRMLETIREYGFGRLREAGEAPEFSRRHRDWYLELSTRADAELRGPDQQTWWTRLESEHDNLRSAISWSLDTGDTDSALRLVASLGWFWFVRGYWHEAGRWLDRSLGDLDADPLSRARAIVMVGRIDIIRGSLDPVASLLEDALPVLRGRGDPSAEAWCLHLRGRAALLEGQPQAGDQLAQGHEAFEAIGDRWGTAYSHRHLADLPGGSERDGRARIDASIEAFTDIGDRWMLASTLFVLGRWHLSNDRAVEAIDAGRQAAEAARSVGDEVWLAHATRVIAMGAYLLGDYERAGAALREARTTMTRIGDDLCIAIVDGYMGLVDLRKDRLDEAASALASSLRGWTKLGSERSAAEYLNRAAIVAANVGDLEVAGRFSRTARRALRETSVELEALIERELAEMAELLEDEDTPGAVAGSLWDVVHEAVAWGDDRA